MITLPPVLERLIGCSVYLEVVYDVGEDLLVGDEAEGAEEDHHRHVLTDVRHHGPDRVALVAGGGVQLYRGGIGRRVRGGWRWIERCKEGRTLGMVSSAVEGKGGLTWRYMVDEDFMPFSTCDRVSHTHRNLCGCRFLKQYTSLLLMRSWAITTCSTHTGRETNPYLRPYLQERLRRDYMWR